MTRAQVATQTGVIMLVYLARAVTPEPKRARKAA
jgi:hypothetical protein